MNILVLMGEKRENRENPVWMDVARILERQSHKVRFAFADEQCWDPLEAYESYDRFIHKSRSPVWINLASALHLQGADILNRLPATLSTINKFAAAALLKRSGLPVPTVILPGRVGLWDQTIKWVLKPTYGHRGQGVKILEPNAEVVFDPRDHFLQQWVEHDGRDYKVKVLGEEVACFIKRVDPNSIFVTGVSTPVSKEMRELALKVGRILGLSMYGMDLLKTPGGWVLVDVNLTPSYRQFPEWTELLASHLAS